MKIEAGLRIGSYTLQEKLGFGTTGIVHKAWHETLGRPVAIKFLPPMHDPLARERFIREGKAMRLLDHPNIVEVLDAGEVEGTPFMVFDYVAGGSLADRVEKGRLTDGEAMQILDNVARALDYAHQQGILHRDVKPANILLTETEMPVIADFGLARLLDQPAATGAGLLSGTPAYMSPEQANGADLTATADQYSLAVTAYELLTGQLPFPGDTVSEVVVALLTREPERPSTHRPDLGPRVDAAILRGLDKRAGKRWQSCRAFTDALLAALASRAIAPVVPTSVAPASAAPTAPPVASTAPAAADFDSSTLMTIGFERDELDQRPRWSWLTSLISSLAPTS